MPISFFSSLVLHGLIALTMIWVGQEVEVQIKPRLEATVVKLIPAKLEIKTEPTPPPQIPMKSAKAGLRPPPSPVLLPTPMNAPATRLEVAEPSLKEPVIGMISELFDELPVDPVIREMSPNASPLPTILSNTSETGTVRPPAALPAPIVQHGGSYRGAGSPNLEPAKGPAYTGPDYQVPTAEIPTYGLNRGEGTVAGGPQPRGGLGEKYQSKTGAGSGAGLTDSIGMGNDILGEGVLPGLLSWLRENRAEFPRIVQAYMETSPGDLCSVTSYAGWDILIQYSEDDHQLKLFLSQGTTGILLADSDFKRRSQFLGMGTVTRAPQITAITSMRDKPTSEKTQQFYTVFSGWLSNHGIVLDERARH